MLSIDSDLQARASLPLASEDVNALVDFYECVESPRFSPLCLAWSLRRALEPKQAYDVWRELMFGFEHEPEETFPRIWAFSARPKPDDTTDRALFDEMRFASEKGFVATAPLQALFDKHDAQIIERIDAENKAWDAQGDREHAEWLASGGTLDPLPTRDKWLPIVEVKPRSNDAVLRVWDGKAYNVRVTGPLAAHAATAEWFRFGDRAGLLVPSGDDGESSRLIYAEGNERVVNTDAEVLGALPPPNNASLVARADTDWTEIDAYSNPVPGCSDNVRVFLRRVGVSLRFNLWLERIEISRSEDAWAAYSDQHFDELMTVAAGSGHRFRPAEATFRRALSTIARENVVDPALDCLADLGNAWDGTPRLASWLSETCGVPRDPYHQAAGAAIVGGMVRRIRRPGCKFDLMAVFVGPQGAGKSTLASLIAPRAEWFSDNVPLGLEPKELLPLLRGKAIIEVSEMRTRGEADAVKAMLSRTIDAARVAYGREPIERPRRNIFVGTANSPEVLEDPTGGRRFLPINIAGEIRLSWLRENIEQIIGEACRLETEGTSFNLPVGVWADAAAHQEAARAKADFEIILEELFAAEHGALVVSSADLLVRMRNSIGRAVAPKLLAAPMRKLGFASVTQRLSGVPTKVWRRGDPEKARRIGQITVVPLLPPVTDNR